MVVSRFPGFLKELISASRDTGSPCFCSNANKQRVFVTKCSTKPDQPYCNAEFLTQAHCLFHMVTWALDFSKQLELCLHLLSNKIAFECPHYIMQVQTLRACSAAGILQFKPAWFSVQGCISFWFENLIIFLLLWLERQMWSFQAWIILWSIAF